MGQAESFVEADESQTDVDQDRVSVPAVEEEEDSPLGEPGVRTRPPPGPGSSPGWSFPRTHHPRRRPSPTPVPPAPHRRYSSRSADSTAGAVTEEALLPRRRTSLHRAASCAADYYLPTSKINQDDDDNDEDIINHSSENFKYPHPLYTNTNTAHSGSHLHFRSLKKAISPVLPKRHHKSKSPSSSSLPRSVPESPVAVETKAEPPLPATTTSAQVKDDAQPPPKQLSPPAGNAPLHSNDPTEPQSWASPHKVESDCNGSTSTRSIGGEIDKTFAFLNSSQPTTDQEDSEINFNPKDFDTSTSTPKTKRKDSSQSSAENLDTDNNNMDVSRSRQSSGVSARESRGYSTAGGSGFFQSGAAGHRSASAQRGSAESSASKSSKKTKSSSKSSKKRSKSETRARSDGSMSDVSVASGSSAKRAKEENKRRIKDRIFRTGHKGSITDRWDGVVHEFEDAKKQPNHKKHEVREQRKVSKIENLEKFDNVKAVYGGGGYGRNVPMYVQQGNGSGPRMGGIEGETASEGSTHSWTAFTPGRRSTNSAESKHQHQTRSYQQGVDAASRRGQSITGDRHIATREGRMSSEAYNHKASGAAANSSGNTNVGQHHKKGVKFHKKTGYDVEDEAVIIVDDAIRRALNLFYGRKGSSSAARMGASARKQQQQHHHHNAVASRKSSAASSGSSNRLAEHRNNRITTNNFFRDFKSENVYRESILRDHRGSSGGPGGQRSMSGTGGIRKHSIIRPIPGTGRRSEGALPPRLRSSSGSLTPGGFYELDITPYGEKEKEKENQDRQSPPRKYSEGTPSRFHVGSSSQQSFSIPALPAPGPGQSIQTSSSLSSLHSPQYQSYPDIQMKSRTGATGPPTISKGNVTRVLHESHEQNFAQHAPGPVIPGFRSMDGLDAEFSTSTWPVTKTQSTDFTSNITENVRLGTTAGNYASQPGGVSMQQAPGMQQPPSLTANWEMYNEGPDYSLDNAYGIGRGTLGYSAYPERPASTPAILQHNMYSPPVSTGSAMYGAYATMPQGVPSGGYGHQRFYQSHHGSTGHLTPGMQQQQQPPQGPLDLHFYMQPHDHTRRRTQSYSNITSPRSPPVRPGKHSSTNDLLEYSAYSNEPIIVADLVDKTHGPSRPTSVPHTHQMTTSTSHENGRFYSSKPSDIPAVNMGKQQTLNFFVFGDRNQDETAEGHDMEPRYARDDFDVSGFYYDRERQRQHDYVDYYNDASDHAYETRSEPDYNIHRMRDMVIHHKQTQTLPPPKKKKPPVVKRMEKKEMQAYRQFPPKRLPPEVHHKETTHYITKERQIEKLPPDPPKRFSHSVQTDLSGSVRKQKPRPQVAKYSSATQYEKPPSPPKPKDTRVEVTNRVFAPRVTETRDFFRETIEPAEPEVVPQKEVPISLKQSPEENVVTIIEEFNRPAERVEVETTTTSREIAKPDDDSDSEMELIETVEVEEREQRLAMAIFEEVEFTFERTKDGQTEVQTGKGSDLLPFQFPGKYEATVDRRKQKCMQVKDCTRGGSHRYEYDANINRHLPAPNYQSAIEMKQDENQTDGFSGGAGQSPYNMVTNEMEKLIRETQNMNLRNSNHNNRSTTGQQQQQQQHVSTYQQHSSSLDSNQPGRQIKVMEKAHRQGATMLPSSSSGYSSSDTAASAAHAQTSHSISAGGPFQMPAHEESDEDDFEHERGGKSARVFTSELKDVNLIPPEGEEFLPETQESRRTKSTRYVSRFDPENVYFTVPEWTATNNEIYDFEKQQQQQKGRTKIPVEISRSTDNDSLPESLPDIAISPDLPDGKKKVNRKHEKHADTPKLRTRVVQDEEGNLMKITEVEKTVTKTEEFTEKDENASNKAEPLRDGEYIDMDLSQITEGQNIQQQQEIIQSSDEEEEFYPVGPEVIGETTVTQIPVEYDEQTTSLGLKDDLDHNFDEQKYLYDMNTATLSPVVTKDSRSGAMLMQYGYNDMLTEL